MMIDERDLDAPWEPRVFKVGQRVRVRLSAECRERFAMLNLDDDHREDGEVGHFPEEDGAIGTIVEWPDYWAHYGPRNGHRIAVRFDPELAVQWKGESVWIYNKCYAISELELIEEEQS